jgi:hypothetical protein
MLLSDEDRVAVARAALDFAAALRARRAAAAG